MERKKNRGFRFFPLAKYMKARQDARRYKAMFEREYIDRALAERRESIARADDTFTSSLNEWLTLYPMQSQSMEELAKWKDAYKEFSRTQYEKYEEKKKGLRVLRLYIGGRTRTFRVSL